MAVSNSHMSATPHAPSYSYPAGAISDAQLARAEEAAARERERYEHEAQEHGETREQASRLQVHSLGTPRVFNAQAVPKQQTYPAPTSQLCTSYLPVQE